MYVCLFWHFHQPVYKDPDSGAFVLPWVNVHTVKNYRQMAVLAEETECPATYNFVPCLLEQIEDYVLGRAEDPYQRAMETSEEDLTERQRDLLRLIVPSGPTDRTIGSAALESLFSPVDAPGRRREDRLELRRRILEGLIPSFRSLRDRGAAELTTSAQFHPLLPLICDLGVADGAAPGRPFRHPEDALEQVRRGREVFARFFGRGPAGFWPSEGGISNEVAETVRDGGCLYALTDENILWKSRPNLKHFSARMKPYDCRGLTILFRDRELSDLIGFEYKSWNERDAVSDLLAKLRFRAGEAAEDAVTVIALDGENPWAGYRDNGVPFLRELYDRLGREPGLVPLTLSDYLEHAPRAEDISLVPGTWLGSFAQWVGHPEKNGAWEALARAREEAGAVEEILIAEGSDWFWWYGEPGTGEFDRLFRGYLNRALRRESRMSDA